MPSNRRIIPQPPYNHLQHQQHQQEQYEEQQQYPGTTRTKTTTTTATPIPQFSSRRHHNNGAGSNGISYLTLLLVILILTVERVFLPLHQVPQYYSSYHQDDNSHFYHGQPQQRQFLEQPKQTTPVVAPQDNEQQHSQKQQCMCETSNSHGHSMTNVSQFHPVYIYRNVQRASSEIPSRDSILPNPPDLTNPYSQVWQDRIIVALTDANDDNNQSGDSTSTSNGKTRRTSKFFVDLAANHPIQLSNTLYLERQGHWKGLCIEGNPEYWYDLARYRSCQIIGAFVGGTGSGTGGQTDGTPVNIAMRSYLTGIVAPGMDNEKQSMVVSRELVSLKTIFEFTNVPAIIDYMSLDVEGAESLIMNDFPFEVYQIRFLTIERPKLDLQQLLQQHGYVMIQTLIEWGETIWYHPHLVSVPLEQLKNIIQNVQGGTHVYNHGN